MKMFECGITKEEFIKKAGELDLGKCYKDVLPIYYELCKKVNICGHSLNPFIPIADLIRRGTQIIDDGNKNPISMSVTGGIYKFDTWIEGVKAHIDSIIAKFGFKSDELSSFQFSFCKYAKMYNEDEVKDLVVKMKDLCTISENDLMGALVLNTLHNNGKITDYNYWFNVLVAQTKPIDTSNVIYLLRKTAL